MKTTNYKDKKVANLIYRRGTIFFSIFISMLTIVFSANNTNAQIATRLKIIDPVNTKDSRSKYPPFRSGDEIRFTAKLEYYQVNSREWVPLPGRKVSLVFHPKAIDLRFSPTPPFKETTDSKGEVTWNVKVNDARLDNPRGRDKTGGRGVSVLATFKFEDSTYIFKGSYARPNFQLYSSKSKSVRRFE